MIMDFEDINPLAVVFGFAGAMITVMMGRYGGEGIPMLWRILTPIATFFVSFFLVQRMLDN